MDRVYARFDEYLANSQALPSRKKLWLGDIYQGQLEPQAVESTFRSGYVYSLHSSAAHPAAAAAGANVDASMSLGRLIEFPGLGHDYISYDHSLQHCLLWKHQLQAKSGNASVDHIQAVYREQCRHRIRSKSSSDSAKQSKIATGPNTYSQLYFPLVYAALVEKNLDLYIDTFPVDTKNEVSEFHEKRHDLISFKTIYAELTAGWEQAAANSNTEMSSLHTG